VCPAPAPLLPGHQFICHFNYVVTQSDIDSGQATSIPLGTPGYPTGFPGGTFGQVVNTATATSMDPSGAQLQSAPQSVVVNGTGSTAAVSLNLTSPTASYHSAGDHVVFNFSIQNTGDISINFQGLGLSPADIVDTDSLNLGPLLTGNCLTDVLAAGQSTTCSATYTATSADVTAGHITENAVVVYADVDFSNAVVSTPQSTRTVNHV
jgi:hypothetical protein